MSCLGRPLAAAALMRVDDPPTGGGPEMAGPSNITDSALIEVGALGRGVVSTRFSQQDIVLSLGLSSFGAWSGTSSSTTSRYAALLARYPLRLRDALAAAGSELRATAGLEPAFFVLFAGDRIVAVRPAREGHELGTAFARVERAVRELRRAVPGVPHGAVGLAMAADGRLELTAFDLGPDLRRFADSLDDRRRLCEQVAATSLPELAPQEPSTGVLQVTLQPYTGSRSIIRRIRVVFDENGAPVTIDQADGQLRLQCDERAAVDTGLLVHLAGSLRNRCGPLRSRIRPVTDAVSGGT